MAQRAKTRARRSTAPAPADTVALTEAVQRLEADLALAQGRIAELESQRNEAVGRIDQAIGSLSGLLAELDA